MNPETFRQFALGMPGALEGAHGGHADFRIGKRVFATLGYPGAAFAMVKLTPKQQEVVVAAEPDVFTPAQGAWGRRGSTLMRLDRVDAATATSALRMAFDNLSRR